MPRRGRAEGRGSLCRWGFRLARARPCSIYGQVGVGRARMTTECESPGCLHQLRLHGADGRCRACACVAYTRGGPGHQTRAARKQIAQALRKW